MRYFYIVTILAVLLSGCSSFDSDDKYENGIIEYEITYLENQIQNYPSALLPKKMKLAFTRHQSINTIEGFMGFFKLDNLTSFNGKKCITHLKVLDKNYVYEGKRNELMCCFDAMENMKIEFTDETKLIAGLQCKKAIIKQGDETSFEVYYTNEIKIENPNITNPYKKIDGVLMEFELKMNNLRMHFIANKFENSKPEKSKLEIPDEAEIITRDQMSYVMNELLN
ncbi:MAG: hypothetical protein JXJ22_08370 [Bacteroidales bacterium]|nr:hypothetical protein [Bacteroidales bacterium]